MTCLHSEFRAEVDVTRLYEGKEVGPGNPDGFCAEITITCAKCGEPFNFIGPPTGSLLEGPTVDPFGTTLRVPIGPGPRTVLDATASYQIPRPGRRKS